MVLFLQGAVAMGCVVAGLFFMRFWRDSHDRLLLHFALSFWLLALSYVLLGTITFANDWRVYVFAVRLFAFLLIVWAILEKNRRHP